VHPEKVKEGDKMYWLDAQGKGDTYVPFTTADWELLSSGKAKL